jgi:glycosyltransferase involved in cell wall biosynthesis
MIVRNSLSVVMPVLNEEAHLAATIEALVVALDGSDFDADLVLVDDGSTDSSVEVARATAGDRVALVVVARGGEGRFEARRTGLEAASGELALLLDARVRLEPDALRFLHERVAAGEMVWNGHVHVDSESAFGSFWSLLAELAWRDYFDNPRTTSFGAADFDRFPKGMGCFVAPREELASAFSSFRARYLDVRLANDDTPILRTIAARTRIGISPQFACHYAPRTSFARFLRHAVHRGTVFVHGHGTPDSRFFPVVAAFFPVTATLALAARRRPALVPIAAAACGLAAAAYGLYAGRSRRELEVLATVTPLYTAGHAIGMWRGAFELLRSAASH